MPSVRYYNQTSPFWDWIAEMENQGNTHPFFGGRSANNEENERTANPWANGFGGGWPFGPMPHRGRHGPPYGHRHRGPPPPPGHEHHGPPPPPGHEHHGPPPPPGHEHHGPPPPPNHEHHGPPPPPGPHTPPEHPESGPSEPRDPPTSFPEEPAGPPPYQGHGPHHGPGRRGRCGGRGGWGGRGHAGPYGFPMETSAAPFLNNLAEMFQSQFFGDNGNAEKETREASSTDFKPEVDIFDTVESFIVHVSLPGAKKEDVGVNWDAEKSELSIAGVVYRPGDEELLKSLALDERKVGAFERKVRLGSRANPAQVDVDAISAKMEDGVLRVTVPKQDAEYVEIKKVDIE